MAIKAFRTRTAHTINGAGPFAVTWPDSVFHHFAVSASSTLTASGTAAAGTMGFGVGFFENTSGVSNYTITLSTNFDPTQTFTLPAGESFALLFYCLAGESTWRVFSDPTQEGSASQRGLLTTAYATQLDALPSIVTEIPRGSVNNLNADVGGYDLDMSASGAFICNLQDSTTLNLTNSVPANHIGSKPMIIYNSSGLAKTLTFGTGTATNVTDVTLPDGTSLLLEWVRDSSQSAWAARVDSPPRLNLQATRSSNYELISTDWGKVHPFDSAAIPSIEDDITGYVDSNGADTMWIQNLSSSAVTIGGIATFNGRSKVIEAGETIAVVYVSTGVVHLI